MFGLGRSRAPRAAEGDSLEALLGDLRRIEARGRRLVAGKLAGGYASLFKGQGLEVDEVREYVEGDDPRAVDASVSARQGRPFIKTFVEERELTLLFVLDLSASMDEQPGTLSPRHAALRVAGSLALSAARDDRVGWVGFSEGVDHWLPARKGSRHALRMLGEMLDARGRSRRTSLAPALRELGQRHRRRSVIVLLSDFVDLGAEDWRGPLGALTRQHEVLAVRLAPAAERPALPSALLRVAEPEGGRRALVDARSAINQSRWRDVRERLAEDLRGDLQRQRVDLLDLPLPTTRDPEAIAAPLAAHFARRARRRWRA